MIQGPNVWSIESARRAPKRMLGPLVSLAADLSLQKMVRLGLVLTMAMLCWAMVVWAAFALVRGVGYWQ
jgi:hypothetical protein